MAYSFRHTSPVLAGTLIKEKVRCGKANCRCIRLNERHEAYYLYWRDLGVLKKLYVSKADVPDLELSIKKAKAEDSEEKRCLRSYRELERSVRTNE